MKVFSNTKFLSLFAAFALSLAAGLPALADDTEIFKGSSNLAAGVQPNIVFILDTSGSMDAEITTVYPYDSTKVYPGTCVTERIYFRENAGPPIDPVGDCENELEEWFNPSALVCDSAIEQLAVDGATGLDYFAQLEPGKDEWKDDMKKEKIDWLVECEDDNGVHGRNAGDPAVYPAQKELGGWTDDVGEAEIWGDDLNREFILFTGNHINWYYGARELVQTRLEIVQQVTNELLDELTDVNVGIMRFSRDADGGMVVHAVGDVASGRAAAQAAVSAMDHGGNTPLSETLYEAAMYYRGDAVDFGKDSQGNGYVSMPSVATSRTGAGLDGGDYYLSPVNPNSLSCQKNFVVLLTDGAPTGDTAANSKTAGLTLPDFEDVTGRTACDGLGDGACLDDIAEYMFKADLNSDPDDGLQNVITYTVGFAVDLPLLKQTAQRGGGNYFLADDTNTLKIALTTILTEVLEDNTTFSAPTIAVNAFNRTRHLDQLYVTVFKSAGRPFWDGNLKKYRLIGDEIVGSDGVTPVVDASTGFFKETARSYWSDRADGAEVPVGGAASRLPAPASRNLYTYTGTNGTLSDASNDLSVTNLAITAAMLDLGPDDPDLDDAIMWARGEDSVDDDGDGDASEARLSMGDPLHARPSTIVYGGSTTTPDEDDLVIYTATNEGYLHAIDGKTGDELFAFIPPNLLPLIKDSMDNDPSPYKEYGLDGNIKSYVVDLNNDGIVDSSAGDKVYLFFGMRRGGSTYYAMDVSNRNAPVLLWMKNETDLPRLGQTWSTPSLTRVEVSGATQNAMHLVMVVGGGYDNTQDNSAYSADAEGNAVYMLDALSGSLLWSAGPEVTDDLVLSDMTNSIPAGVRVIDMNTDGIADRMYVGDMGGRVWRFDVFSGQTAANLVTGGVMASLGAADLASPTLADNRRFYNTPDVSFVRRESGGYFNVAIGSGYRAHPLSGDAVERFYSLRDYQPFRQLSAVEFLTYSSNKLTDSDARLADITGTSGSAVPTVPSGAIGWKMTLGSGEKVLAESRTFDEKIFFTSYIPESGVTTTLSCVPQRGSNKLYVVNVADGSPTINLDGIGSDEALTIEDRAQSLAQTGIAPEVTFLFQPDPESDGGGGGGGSDCTGFSGTRPKCMVGVEDCAADFCNAPKRTFWTQDDATEDE